MSKNDVISSIIMFTIILIIGIVFIVVFYIFNPDFMRYEVAINSLTGKPCYIKDWDTGKKLPVSKEFLNKADGSFYCDHSQCE